MKNIIVAVVSLLFLALQGCGLFSDHGTKLTFGASELYYKDGVSKEEAQKLGEYLQAQGFFDDQAPKSVQIVKKDDRYIFKLIIEPDKIVEEGTERSLRFASMDIAADVFNQAKVDIDLTDELFKTQKTIKSPGERFWKETAKIYRTNETNATTCDRVVDFLAGIGFIGNAPLTLSFDVKGDDFIYEMVTEKGAEFNLESVAANKSIAGLISIKALNNKPIELHYLADDFSIKASYSFEEIQAAYLEFLGNEME